MVEGHELACFDINTPLRKVTFHVPLVKTPICVIAWEGASLMTNKLTVVTTIPVVEKRTELQLSWSMHQPLDIWLYGSLESSLPLVGQVNVSEEMSLASYKARYSTSVSGSTVPTVSLSSLMEYDSSSKHLHCSAETTFSGSTYEISVVYRTLMSLYDDYNL